MLAAAKTSSHPDPIDLSVGEPSYDPPEVAKQRAVEIIQQGLTQYGPAAGLPQLRAAVAKTESTQSGLTRSVDETIITAGGKQALMTGLQCLLEPGDEVLILAPYWPSFVQQVQWCSATPIIIHPKTDLTPDIDALTAAINTKTKVIIINTPNNPTSYLLSSDTLKQIGQLAIQHDLWILCDQVYQDLILHEGNYKSLLTILPELQTHTIVVNSFSKQYCLTGYRIGSAIAPKSVIQAMTRLISASTTHASIIAQHAALAALTLSENSIKPQIETYKTKQTKILSVLRSLLLDIRTPEAAMYVFPNIEPWLQQGKFRTSSEIVDSLRNDAGLKLVLGDSFGVPNHVRISYGCSEQVLDKAITRLQDWAKNHLELKQ